MINLILFGTFFIFLLLNTPIAVSLGMSSILAMIYAGDKMSVIPTNLFSGMAKFLLLAIPFFVLSGNVMAESGISKRLVHFIDNCIGHVRGGIAIVCVVVAMFFGAISGSGPATVAALGIILIPAMINQGGFSAPFASSLMAAASSIAIVIPPSIAFVVYASITGVSVGEMFMAGIVPGIMMGLALIAIVLIEVRKKGIVASRERASWGDRLKSFGSAFWGLMVPVIILGGIYGGIFTPTEAAAVSVVYALLVGMFIYREVKWKQLVKILVDSGKTTGGIMLIIGAATLFSFVCTKHGISKAAQGLLLNVAGNKYVFLLTVKIIFLIADPFRHYRDREPRNRTGNTAGWSKPLCGDRHQRQDERPERQDKGDDCNHVRSGLADDYFLRCRAAAHHLCPLVQPVYPRALSLNPYLKRACV